VHLVRREVARLNACAGRGARARLQGEAVIELTPCNNVCVFAPVSSGKTNLLRLWLANENRYVRFDYTGETRKENDPSVEHYHDPRGLLDRLEKNPYYFRIAYHPGKNVMEHYRWCQRAIWMLDTPRWMVVDEYHRVCPQGPRLDEDVEAALRLARHNQLGLIGLSQRPQDVNKLFVDSCRLCVVFRSQESNFLNACGGHWGNDVADAIAELRPLVYDEVNKVCKQKQQCVVITRDGNAPRVYDFATDQFIPLDAFLAGEAPEPPEEPETHADQPDALRSDLAPQRARDERVPDDAGIPDE